MGKKWHIMMVKYLTGDNDVANDKKKGAKNVRSKKKKVLSFWASWWSLWFDSLAIVFSPFFIL